MADGARITVRFPAAQLATLDALAAEGGVPRSVVLRRLVDDAGGEAPAKLDRDDLIRLLEERARAGSAPAIRELLARKEQAAQIARLRDLTT